MVMSAVDAITILSFICPSRCDGNQSAVTSKSGETLAELIRTIEMHLRVLKRLRVSRRCCPHNFTGKKEAGFSEEAPTERVGLFRNDLFEVGLL